MTRAEQRVRFWCDPAHPVEFYSLRDQVRKTVTLEPDHERCPGRNWAGGSWHPCPCPCHQTNADPGTLW